MHRVLPRLWPFVGVLALLFLPVASCTSRGTDVEHTVDFTGLDVLRNRPEGADEWVQLARWSVTVGTNMARAHPLIGHEGPSDPQAQKNPLDVGRDLRAPDPPTIFPEDDRWPRIVLALVLAVALLGVVLRPRAVRSLVTGGAAALGLVLFLFLFEQSLRRSFGDPTEGLEFRWEVGTHVALGAFLTMVVTSSLAIRRSRKAVPTRSGTGT